jgi:SNF2 family DNA or RNA helicase
MSSSPKKHRGPFRPVDTLSSTQKPLFIAALDKSKQQATANRAPRKPFLDSSLSESAENSLLFGDDHEFAPQNHSEIDFLGNSSSLFDEGYAQSPDYPPPPSQRSTNIAGKGKRDMVRQREPLPDDTTRDVPKAVSTLAIPPVEFGQASPLRNPLKKDVQRDSYAYSSNVPKSSQPPPAYNAGNHAPAGRSNPLFIPQQHKMSLPTGNAGSGTAQPIKRNPPQESSRYSLASSAGSDILEIPAAQFQPKQAYQGVPVPRPMNLPAQTVQPAPRPIYSSIDYSNGFRPVNSSPTPLNPHGSRQTIILDNLPDDDFDPDAAIRAQGQKFGAPDAYAYVDNSQANENIKALLEGAFDDEEAKIPRTRGRKKKKQQQEQEEAKTLAEKLRALEVKDKEIAEEKPEDEGEDEEEDDGTVDGMKVKLLPHQVDGVAWMIEMETGAHFKRKQIPKGGILADDMGLGKTIQSIALILSNPRPAKDAQPENKKNVIEPIVAKGTLIIAPLALIKQWESEINTKISSSHSLKVLVHHGPSRTKSAEKLKGYDVVITTYQVLASEHASCGDGPDGLKKGCFGVHWYRVILDEAHTIKNRNAKMTKASYDVRSHYRWCLTGTPMQNNLDELQSLIKFLRIKPYSEIGAWKESITGPMKGGRGNLAMRRLQIFLKTFMKRRTKEVLKKDGALNFGGKNKEGDGKSGFQIVDRNIETVIGSFTPQERAFYDRLSSRAESRLAEMMGGAKQDYIGALVLLLRLRQACNHPNLTKSNVKDDKDALTTGSKSGTQSDFQTPRKSKDTDADDLADLLGGLSVQTKRCDICQASLTKNNAASGAIRCDDCEADLNTSQQKVKKHKKHRKHKHKDRAHKKDREPKQAIESEEEDEEVKAPKNSRQRRVIMDSDDEDEQEGEWLVPEDQQNQADLGKAGGTDDEDAEGGGDTIGAEDSDTFASHDESAISKSEEDSFIVHDTDSEDEAPGAHKKQLQKKKKKVINLDSDEDNDSGSESSGEESGSETDSEESETGESDLEYEASDLTPSTKIRQLLSILEKETPDHKVIVFSQFTSMLDLIEPFLRREGYNFTRYDGSMRNDLREASLQKLREDKRTRVLLCSLKCGSLGLNLTAASRVVIMEPFWNPVSHFIHSTETPS